MDSFYHSSSEPNGGLRKWFLGALIVSLIVHGALFVVFSMSKLERFEGNMTTERLVPRPFSMKPAQFDPKVFEPEPEAAPEARKKPVAPKLPEMASEKPSTGKLPDKVKLSPTATEPLNPIVNEKPAAFDSNLAKAVVPQPNAAIENELNAARRQFVDDAAPKVAANSALKLPGGIPSPGQEGDSGSGTVPGFSNLDDLLAQSGPLTGNVAPVNMPGGALFEYDSSELRDEAVRTLEKLGELIKRNPEATFSVEGHSDAIGDPAYNVKLSEARANKVKQWLVDNMGLDTARIQTKGFGSTRLLAPANGTREEQQINRRVEIVIRTPR